MHRGCRQGGPVSPYLFVLYAEILAIFIYQNTDIKDIVVNEHKISWICRRYISYPWWFCGLSLYCLDTLELYATFSGLKINSTKTKVTYIGWKKKSAEVFHQSRWKLDWRETTFFLLRIHFSVELNRMINLNDNIPLPKITKWSSILCIWFWF